MQWLVVSAVICTDLSKLYSASSASAARESRTSPETLSIT